MTPILFAAAMLVFQSSAATVAAPAEAKAPPATVQKTAEATPPKANKDGKICHKEAVLGSRLPVRVCRTPEEAAIAKAETRDMLDRAQRDLSNTGQ